LSFRLRDLTNCSNQEGYLESGAPFSITTKLQRFRSQI